MFVSEADAKLFVSTMCQDGNVFDGMHRNEPGCRKRRFTCFPSCGSTLKYVHVCAYHFFSFPPKSHLIPDKVSFNGELLLKQFK